MYVFLKSTNVESYIKNTLVNILKQLGLSKNFDHVINEIIDEAKKEQDLTSYEKNCHRILRNINLTELISKNLNGRAKLISNQIKNYIVGEKLCDVGCGDGKVSEILSEDMKISLFDVYKHDYISNLEKKGMDFRLVSPQGAFPFPNNSQDTVLLITVLHHSVNPLKTLKQSVDLLKKGGRIIAIESVYGLDKHTKIIANNEKEYLKLNKDEQFKTNIFFDHFYNRIIHYTDDLKNKVPVPFNFQTISDWKKTAESLGLKEIKLKLLGLDQPIVPEYHSLHVWVKNK